MSRKENGGSKEAATETMTVKRATPNGRILYDVDSIIGSKTAKRHFENLDRLNKRGLIKKSPAKSG